MTDIGPTGFASGYVSDEEIMEWLQAKSDAQNGQLRSMMIESDQRGALIKELADLKANLDNGKMTPAEVRAKAESIEAEFADTPFAADVDALLDPLISMISANSPPADPASVEIDPNQQGDVATATKDAGTASNTGVLWGSGTRASGSPVNSATTTTTTQGATSPAAYSAPQLSTGALKDAFGGSIQDEIDSLNHDDGLELIKIQSLVSDERQTQELGSNILSSRSQTDNSIIGNIRG